MLSTGLQRSRFFYKQEKSPKRTLETLFLVNLPAQFWKTFWPSLELLHDNLIMLGVSDHELMLEGGANVGVASARAYREGI